MNRSQFELVQQLLCFESSLLSARIVAYYYILTLRDTTESKYDGLSRYQKLTNSRMGWDFKSLLEFPKTRTYGRSRGYQRVRGTYRRGLFDNARPFTSKPLFAIQSILRVEIYWEYIEHGVLSLECTINFYKIIFRTLALRILIISINRHCILRLWSLSCALVRVTT